MKIWTNKIENFNLCLIEMLKHLCFGTDTWNKSTDLPTVILNHKGFINMYTASWKICLNHIHNCVLINENTYTLWTNFQQLHYTDPTMAGISRYDRGLHTRHSLQTFVSKCSEFHCLQTYEEKCTIFWHHFIRTKITTSRSIRGYICESWSNVTAGTCIQEN
jgi:hypothetical protein